MEALSIPLPKGLPLAGREREGEEVRTEAFSSWGSSTDGQREEPRRRVSFADAFGLDLVSVKEYDEEVGEREAPAQEEFHLSCLFAAPQSEEELLRRLQGQMAELESVELLPGTATLRGCVRVLNLCFSKSVYARITLDSWKSYFDLPAEYVPGSSDRKTDRFTFQYTLVPPPEKTGTRVEFCLRYETSAGTFWANNQEMNYVIICHRKSPAKQQVHEDPKRKRSCLRANRRASTQEQENTDTVTLAAETEAARDAEGTRAERKPMAAGPKSRQRAARLMHVKEIFSQRWGQASSRQPADAPQPSGEFLLQRKQVLTYHQIPLITLDWDNEQPQWVSSNMDNIRTGRAKVTLSKASEENVKGALSVNDIWANFLNGEGASPDDESSVCDVWQAFIRGPPYVGDGGVPESEWLQSAASVRPATENRHAPRNARPATLAASAVGQAPSHAPPAHVSSESRQLSETCVGGGENRVALRSRTRPVATGDSSSECHERKEDRIKGGLKGDEASVQLAAGGATSRRGSRTSDVTAGAQIASGDDDRILPGESPEREVTGDTVASSDTKRQGAEDGASMHSMRAVASTAEEVVEPPKNEPCENQTENEMSRELRNQTESPERVNFDQDWEGTGAKNEESDPIVAKAFEAIESRQTGDDSVRGVHGHARAKANDNIAATVDHDPSGRNKGSTEESGQLTRGPSDGFMWWSVLYILSHITRIVTCSLPVAGFVVVVVLYDFPAFFAVYVFSMAWWFCKWRGARGATNKSDVS
ncbi:uncharacterized protein ppp1r3aa [Hippocampus zosterae]|uniref:uncharacterized protein ppp1r3aa n=1 Tax=Hippocampus zosterae TaxID=109293 RepID=UPI00223CD530|nr:uncharacterized protein ppp1r3aa [Hippocampus zosterae]